MPKPKSGDLLSWLLSLVVAVVLVLSVWLFADHPERSNSSARAEPLPPAALTMPEASLATVRLPPPPAPVIAAPPAPVSKPDIRKTPPPVTVTPLKSTPVARAPSPEPPPLSFAALRPTPTPDPAPVVRKPEPKVIPAPDPAPEAAREIPVDAGAIAEGRTLLRLLEHGKGPSIEISWPGGEAARERLFRHLRACLGMRVAVMDARNRLFLATGPRNAPTELNLDRFSGFMRTPAGRMSSAERRLADTIRARHDARGNAVRLFPRRVDAKLLGGLSLAIGGAYRTARTIRAGYQWAGNRLYVGSIRVDGRAVAGLISLARGCVRSA